MAHDIFISHSSKDKVTADAICHALEQNGVRCWIAPRDVRAGHTYGAEIIEAIESCAVLVLLFSGNSNASEDVKNEIQNAFTAKKVIIPYRMDDAQMDSEMKYFLSRKHWIDAYPDDTVFEELVATVNNTLGRGGAATVPTPPALAPVVESTPARATDDVVVGNTISFGEYHWHVLDVQDGKALLITKYIIGLKVFNDEPEKKNTWETCDLRGWLNGNEFLGKFGERERSAIDSEIFLLSVEEAEKYFHSDSDRVARRKGENSGLWMWLRSPGWGSPYTVAGIDEYGRIYSRGNGILTEGGVRPAMWIKID